MAFKMEGPSLYPNYRGKKEKMININHEGPAGAADGRASSSPFQRKTGAKTKEELLKEGFTPRDADQMIKDGAVTGVVDNKKKKKKKKKKDMPVKPKPGDYKKYSDLEKYDDDRG
tara:strand:+ start:333 stop:677 length:345 start_codon:yes stop_codon:yes gene_type:complete